MKYYELWEPQGKDSYKFVERSTSKTRIKHTKERFEKFQGKRNLIILTRQTKI